MPEIHSVAHSRRQRPDPDRPDRMSAARHLDNIRRGAPCYPVMCVAKDARINNKSKTLDTFFEALSRTSRLARKVRAIAATEKPRRARAPTASSRHIPAAVRRAVWQRDGGRCAFHGTRGRCSETGWLEFHHVRPFAAGGESSVDNIELRCRAHNVYEADKYFGPGESFFSSDGSALSA